MTKTDRMLLIEARAGKDVRDVLSEAYDATEALEQMPAWIEERYGVAVTFGLLHRWITINFQGSIRKHLEFPGYAPATEAVPA